MYDRLIDFFVDVTFTVAHTVRMFIVSWWNLCRKSQSTCKSSLDSIILPQQNLRCLMKYIRAIFNRIVLSLSHHSPLFYGLLLRRHLHRSARTLLYRDCHNRGTCMVGEFNRWKYIDGLLWNENDERTRVWFQCRLRSSKGCCTKNCHLMSKATTYRLSHWLEIEWKCLWYMIYR